MKSTICVPLLLLLLLASCHGFSVLTGPAGTTADWSSQKGRRQGSLIERIVITENELPTDRPSSTVVMFTGDSSLLERRNRAQARRRGWTVSLSDPGLPVSTTRHGTVAAVTSGRTFDPNESRRDLDGALFDQVCA